MGNSSENGNSFKLLEWDIQRVKKGLDEDVVAKIITELVNQRDALTKRTEHLSSLTRLAEETVANADKLAKQMQDEANERANNEATAVIAKAEEEANKLRVENQRIQRELRESSDILCKKLISEPENFIQQIKNVWAETDSRMTNLLESTEPTTATTVDNADSEPETQPSEQVAVASTEPTTAAKTVGPTNESNTPPLWRDTSWS